MIVGVCIAVGILAGLASLNITGDVVASIGVGLIAGIVVAMIGAMK